MERLFSCRPTPADSDDKNPIIYITRLKICELQKMNFHYLRIISDLSGLLGSLLIFFYGIPRQIDTGGKIGMALLSEDTNELQKIKRYKFLGNTGIIFIGLSFILMLVIDTMGG